MLLLFLHTSCCSSGLKTRVCSPTRRTCPSAPWCWGTSGGRAQRLPTGWDPSVAMETVSSCDSVNCFISFYFISRFAMRLLQSSVSHTHPKIHHVFMTSIHRHYFFILRAAFHFLFDSINKSMCFLFIKCAASQRLFLSQLVVVASSSFFYISNQRHKVTMTELFKHVHAAEAPPSLSL